MAVATSRLQSTSHRFFSVSFRPLSAISFDPKSLLTTRTVIHLDATSNQQRDFSSRGGEASVHHAHKLRRNYALEKYKTAGLVQLQETAREVAAKTRKSLLSDEDEDSPTPSMLAEGHRIHEHLTLALEQFSRKDNTFCIKDDPIIIMEVEVSRDLKIATVYWALPYSLLDIPDNVAEEITRRMQTILIRRGGRLQTLVHGRLRHYFPPKLRFEPSEDATLRQTMKDLFNRN